MIKNRTMKQKKLMKGKNNAINFINNKKLLKNTKFLLFLIVLFGLALRLIFFSGMGTSDSLAYSKAANDIDKGIDPDSTLTLTTRMGLICATALSYTLFGINDFSSVLFTLLTSIGSIILIFYFGKLFFNEKTGLMAAFLLSFFPLDVVYSTKLLSDLPSAFFMALGVYFFLYSEIKSKLKYNLGYFLSGIFIGIGYMIRESALLIGLFFLIYAIYKKRIKKEYFIVALGFLVVFLIEMLIFYILAGNPLFRSIASQEYLAEAMVRYNYFGRLSFPIGLLHYPYVILTTNLLSYFYAFIFISIMYCWMFRKKETRIMQFWFISLLLYLSFGSASLTHYAPFRAVDRYLAIITVPGILLLAYFLSEKKTIIKKSIMPLILIVLLLTSIIFVYLREDRNLLNDLREIEPYLKDLDKTTYMDSRSLKALNYISRYKNIPSLEPYPEDLTSVNDAYLVINKWMIRNLREANNRLKFPKEIDLPDKNWVKVKEIGKEDKDKLLIYYIP